MRTRSASELPGHGRKPASKVIKGTEVAEPYVREEPSVHKCCRLFLLFENAFPHGLRKLFECRVIDEQLVIFAEAFTVLCGQIGM